MTTNLNNAVTGEYGTPTFSVGGEDTDGIVGKKTEWINEDWHEEYSAFKNISEYQNTILMLGYWHTGKGYEADSRTQVLLDHVSGWGKDTFGDVIFNQDIMSIAAKDSFAQIITDNNNLLLNLKPLNPGSIKIIVGEDGRITEYQQISRNKEGQAVKKFSPDEIFHLSYNRVADQIHGTSIYQKLKPIIEADQTLFKQIKKAMVYQAQPFILWKLKTDDTTKIANFVARVKSARKLGDDLFVPDDDNVATWEVIQISPAQLMLQFQDELRNKFYRSAGLPQIVPGGGEKGTGSESRTIYLAFEQLVAQRQLYLQNQIWAQLKLKVRFNPPTTMSDLIGKTEDKTNQFAAQPSEVNPAQERQ